MMQDKKRYYGNFIGKLDSQYDYRKWSIVDIDCVRYSTFVKIVEAISPILEEERKEMKEHFEKEKE